MEFYLTIQHSMLDFTELQWNRVTQEIKHPFFSWSWLVSLEVSGSVTPMTGWEYRIIALWSKNPGGKPQLCAALPIFVRDTSWGELFFDFGWEEIAQQVGGRYFPKLVSTVPATPAKGLKILTDSEIIAPGSETEEAAWGLVLEAAEDIMASEDLAQLAFLFLDPDFAKFLSKRGYHLWAHHQFCWHNPGYTSFEEYLEGVFKKNQRRNIRRERRTNAREGYHYRIIPGSQAPPEAWQQMYYYYDKTNSQFGPFAARFLTPEFFQELAVHKPAYVVLVAAYRDEPGVEELDPGAPMIDQGWLPNPVGMALLGKGESGIFGRYWGADEESGFLHFNLCYYVPQQWAIEQGLEFFDPGVGSMHKTRRGFDSQVVYSAHRFSDPVMERIWKDNIPHINKQMRDQISQLNSHMPIKSVARESPKDSP